MAIQLKIVLWNANGLVQHAEEVTDYIQNKKADIMLISETHFTKKSYIKIPKYKIYDTQHPEGITHHLHGHHNLEHLKATSVTIEHWIRPLTIAAVDCPPNTLLKLSSSAASMLLLDNASW
jgi:hypothetical protein